MAHCDNIEDLAPIHLFSSLETLNLNGCHFLNDVSSLSKSSSLRKIFSGGSARFEEMLKKSIPPYCKLVYTVVEEVKVEEKDEEDEEN